MNAGDESKCEALTHQDVWMDVGSLEKAGAQEGAGIWARFVLIGSVQDEGHSKRRNLLHHHINLFWPLFLQADWLFTVPLWSMHCNFIYFKYISYICLLQQHGKLCLILQHTILGCHALNWTVVLIVHTHNLTTFFLVSSYHSLPLPPRCASTLDTTTLPIRLAQNLAGAFPQHSPNKLTSRLSETLYNKGIRGLPLPYSNSDNNPCWHYFGSWLFQCLFLWPP